MSKKIYYKITNKELGSYMAKNKAYIQYKIREFVTAPDWLAKQGYYLLVFDSLEHAKNECCSFNDKIWKCEVRDIQKNLPCCHYIYEVSKGFLPKNKTNIITWPKGTIMAKEVKLIKEIKI